MISFIVLQVVDQVKSIMEEVSCFGESIEEEGRRGKA
jgi:hypothetical protein